MQNILRKNQLLLVVQECILSAVFQNGVSLSSRYKLIHLNYPSIPSIIFRQANREKSLHKCKVILFIKSYYHFVFIIP